MDSLNNQLIEALCQTHIKRDFAFFLCLSISSTESDMPACAYQAPKGRINYPLGF